MRNGLAIRQLLHLHWLFTISERNGLWECLFRVDRLHLPIPRLVWGIHIAYQSQVHEIKNVSMAEKCREGGFKSDYFLLSTLQLSKLTYSTFKWFTFTINKPTSSSRFNSGGLIMCLCYQSYDDASCMCYICAIWATISRYLVDLPSLGRYPLLRLLLQDLLPLLHILFGGRCQRVVELVEALVHHVPVSVSLLWNGWFHSERMIVYIITSMDTEWKVGHLPSGLPPTVPFQIHCQTGFLPVPLPFYLKQGWRGCQTDSQATGAYSSHWVGWMVPFPWDRRGVEPKCFLSLAHSLYL